MDLWLGSGLQKQSSKNSKDAKLLLRKAIEVDERFSGALGSFGNKEDLAEDEIISFPLNIKQTIGERQDIEATVKNQGLFNYGERPTLFVVIQLLSLKFQNNKTRHS